MSLDRTENTLSQFELRLDQYLDTKEPSVEDVDALMSAILEDQSVIDHFSSAVGEEPVPVAAMEGVLNYVKEEMGWPYASDFIVEMAYAYVRKRGLDLEGQDDLPVLTDEQLEELKAKAVRAVNLRFENSDDNYNELSDICLALMDPASVTSLSAAGNEVPASEMALEYLLYLVPNERRQGTGRTLKERAILADDILAHYLALYESKDEEEMDAHPETAASLSATKDAVQQVASPDVLPGEEI